MATPVLQGSGGWRPLADTAGTTWGHLQDKSLNFQNKPAFNVYKRGASVSVFFKTTCVNRLGKKNDADKVISSAGEKETEPPPHSNMLVNDYMILLHYKNTPS